MRMKKQIFALALLAVAGFILSGCTAVRNYSLRSYQGPLPMEDYRHVDPDSYGIPTTAR